MKLTASITKDQLRIISPHYGSMNAATFRGYKQDTLTLVTFRGAINLETRLYDGVYVFAETKRTDKAQPVIDFNELPGIPAKKGKADGGNVHHDD